MSYFKTTSNPGLRTQIPQPINIFASPEVPVEEPMRKSRTDRILGFLPGMERFREIRGNLMLSRALEVWLWRSVISIATDSPYFIRMLNTLNITESRIQHILQKEAIDTIKDMVEYAVMEN